MNVGTVRSTSTFTELVGPQFPATSRAWTRTGWFFSSSGARAVSGMSPKAASDAPFHRPSEGRKTKPVPSGPTVSRNPSTAATADCAPLESGSLAVVVTRTATMVELRPVVPLVAPGVATGVATVGAVRSTIRTGAGFAKAPQFPRASLLWTWIGWSPSTRVVIVAAGIVAARLATGEVPGVTVMPVPEPFAPAAVPMKYSAAVTLPLPLAWSVPVPVRATSTSPLEEDGARTRPVVVGPVLSRFRTTKLKGPGTPAAMPRT